MNTEIIKININGIDVKGEIIHRSLHDISVKIIEPYNGINIGCHIPYFASYKNFLSGYGLEKAEELLEELYYLTKYLNNQVDILKRALIQYREDEFYILKKIDGLKTQKRKLQSDLKSDKIEEKQYQKKIKKVEREIMNFQNEVKNLYKDYFGDFLEVNVSSDYKNQILNYLTKL